MPKVGLDDFLAAGNTVADLMSFASTELRDLPGDAEATDMPYRSTPQGMFQEKHTQDGIVLVPLTNFQARVVCDVIEDDGAETRRLFNMEAAQGERVVRFTVPAAQFASLNWVVDALGPGAIIFAGQGTKDHARAAIQAASLDAAVQHVRTHTGWAKFGDQHGWCHAGGVIGSMPPDAASVHLDGTLALFSLPTPPEGAEEHEAIRATLRLWELGKAEVIGPVWCGIWRSVLGQCDFSLFLAGPSGAFKSEGAALIQQHFGAGMNSRNFPANWSSTDNSLEGLAHRAKDALMFIDEFVPKGSVHEQQRYHAKADRVLRNQGNNAGRGRMRADGTLQASKYPRGLIGATGEEVPTGQSLRARMLVIEVSKGDIQEDRLTACQEDAAAGLYAQAMAGYLSWLAPRYEEVRAGMRAEVVRFRDAAAKGDQHKRTAEIVANLALGLNTFLEYAAECGAITEAEQDEWFKRGWKALVAATRSQHRLQADSESTQRYLELLAAALAAGKAHVADLMGGAPDDAAAWGWRAVNPDDAYATWLPQGDRIGWVSGNSLYLNADAAFNCAQRMGQESGDTLAVGPKTLNKRLHERGLLESTDQARDTLYVRKTAQGAQQKVLHLAKSRLIQSEE